MNHIYCTECGAKVEYAYSKPKFCSGCGEKLGGLHQSIKKTEKTVKNTSLAEDETEVDEVPTLLGGLNVDIESDGNHVFELNSLVGEESDKKEVREKRSRSIDDFIDDRRG